MFNGDRIGEIRVKGLNNACHLPSGSLLAAVNNASTVFCFDLATGAPALAGSVTLTTSYTQVSFITSTGVVAWGPAQPVYVDLSAGTSVLLTTQSASPYTGTKQNVLAANASTHKALGASATAGKLISIDASSLPTTPATAAVNPTGLGSVAFTTCIVKDSTTWLVGSSTGSIYELNFTGSIIKTIVLPTTPNFGTAIVHEICNLSYSAAADSLIVTTTQGWCFQYTYSTSTLIWQMLIREGSGASGTNSGIVLTEQVNGQWLHHSAVFQGDNIGMMVANMIAGNANFGCMEIDSFLYAPGNSSGNCISGGLNSTSNYAWFAYLNSSAPAGGIIRYIGIDGLQTGSAPARAQNPAGTDVTARLTRLVRYKPGVSRLESDQSITAGANSITANVSNALYSDIYTIGTVGTSEQFDIRTFDN